MITRSRAGLLGVISAAAAILGLLWARPILHRTTPAAPRTSMQPAVVRADGSDAAILVIEASPTSAPPRITMTANPRGVALDEPVPANGRWEAQVRPGINPGRASFRIDLPGLPPASTELTVTLNPADTFEDGTPDFLRLDDDTDRRFFRRWFTWLAEAQYFQMPSNRPAEINDCAALIRYAYRESVHTHDPGWAEAARLPLVPAFAAIAKYQYPYTPLGAALFRVKPGPFLPPDLAGGAFAEFADAQTLWRFNTHRVGRDLASAQPGDLLFFRHDGGQMPFHSMIYLGESQLRRDGHRYLLYHTGPDRNGTDPGEMKRLTTEELLRYPQPEWRPIPENSGFLGVFRWNILRRTSDHDDSNH